MLKAKHKADSAMCFKLVSSHLRLSRPCQVLTTGQVAIAIMWLPQPHMTPNLALPTFPLN